MPLEQRPNKRALRHDRHTFIPGVGDKPFDQRLAHAGSPQAVVDPGVRRHDARR